METKYLHSDITSDILKAFFKVYNALGYGFLEKVYQNAMCIELRKMGYECVANFGIKVYFENEEVGYYSSDIVVNKIVIAELKAKEALREEHEAQLTNYLKATDIEVGMLLNFGPRPEYKRKVFSAQYKTSHYRT